MRHLLAIMLALFAVPGFTGLQDPWDFVPGEKLLIYDDYTDMSPGGAPPHWKVRGSTLRLTGRGAVGPRGGGAGDLYVHIRVAAHEIWRREGDDLVADLPISIAQAALGTTITLPMLDGEPEDIAVPHGTQPGKEFVQRGRGDLRVRVDVRVPTKLSEFEAELLKKYADSRGEAVGEASKGLFSRIKSAFS